MDLVTTTVFSPGIGPDAVWLDQMLVEPRLGLLAVADAPSGGEVGRAGIRIALDAARRHLERHGDVFDRFRAHPTAELRTRILEAIDEAFARAAQEVFAFARRHRGLLVTLDVVLLLEHEAFVGHVGDGRVYLVRRGLVHQLTIDHSRGDEAVVFEQPAEAAPTEDGVRAGGRTFMRALGPLPGVRVESMCMELMPEDRVAVCASQLPRVLSESALHGHLVGDELDVLAPSMMRSLGGRPAVAVVAQLGSGASTGPEGARTRLAVLAPIPLFAHCNERELRAIATATRPRWFEANRTVFRQGDAGEELFLVVSGRVRIERNGQTLVTLGPGSNFGEMSLLDERTRSATAVTAEPCELLVIHREAFYQLLRSNPTLATKILWNMLLRLSSNLRVTSSRLAELGATAPSPNALMTEAPAPRTPPPAPRREPTP